MNVLSRRSLGAVALLFLVDCAHRAPSAAPEPEVPSPTLRPPDLSFDVQRYSTVIGWPEGTQPVAPDGFEVTRYADGFQNPRWMYVLHNGDVLVAEAASLFKDEEDRAEAIETGKVRSQNIGTSANRITLLRDADGDGRPEVREVFLEGLNQPLGMALVGNQLYVAVGSASNNAEYGLKEEERRVIQGGCAAPAPASRGAGHPAVAARPCPP
ncbi:hypothetical protein [Myxococcus sp. AM009]|uniref:hypothetical protein n=1 Tax=Myxococcus sp. AM009 TaxID=2745137 RepID=UPI0020CD1A5E|nr:hypothetical protein [Myxococcus sp. AM009]